MLQHDAIVGGFVAVALLGAIVGSFLNALLFRYNTGRSVMRGRSACMRCGHTLHAVDLVPVLSYVLLRGKCRYCRARISLQYPLIEAAAAALAVGTWALMPDPLMFTAAMLVHLTLLFIFVYDLRHTVIPWPASLLLMALSVGYIATANLPWWDLAAGPLLALPLFLFSLVSRGRWMGWGDAPLQLSLGWFLGLTMGLTALMLAFWSGALVGIGLLVLAKGYRMRSEVPFAPFLISAAWVAYFFHVDFFPLLPLLF